MIESEEYHACQFHVFLYESEFNSNLFYCFWTSLLFEIVNVAGVSRLVVRRLVDGEVKHDVREVKHDVYGKRLKWKFSCLPSAACIVE